MSDDVFDTERHMERREKERARERERGGAMREGGATYPVPLSMTTVGLYDAIGVRGESCGRSRRARRVVEIRELSLLISSAGSINCRRKDRLGNRGRIGIRGAAGG